MLVQFTVSFIAHWELKLVKVHHECLMHAWLQVIKVEEPTVLIVWSVERLFSLTMKKSRFEVSVGCKNYRGDTKQNLK